VFIERQGAALILKTDAAAWTDRHAERQHHKCKKLMLVDIYWWTERQGCDSRWPDAKEVPSVRSARVSYGAKPLLRTA
jgi:hypothetical protein